MICHDDGGHRRNLRLISRQQSISVRSSSRVYIPDRRHSFPYRIFRGRYRGWKSHAVRSEDTNKLSAPCILVAVARTRKRTNLPSLCRTVVSCRILQVISYRNKYARRRKNTPNVTQKEKQIEKRRKIFRTLSIILYLYFILPRQRSIRYQLVLLGRV